MIEYHPIATQIYNLLIQDEITEKDGEITFDFLNISVKINEKSAIGDLFQEWFAEWMRQKNINFRTKQNTQEFPDFLVDETSEITGLLEIKAFYSSPNFDVANFEAYCDSITKQAYRLDADYLIFSYDIQDYKFKVKKVWLKRFGKLQENLTDILLDVKRKETSYIILDLFHGTLKKLNINHLLQDMILLQLYMIRLCSII